jgi:hypothetical protein
MNQVAFNPWAGMAAALMPGAIAPLANPFGILPMMPGLLPLVGAVAPAPPPARGPKRAAAKPKVPKVPKVPSKRAVKAEGGSNCSTWPVLTIPRERQGEASRSRRVDAA